MNTLDVKSVITGVRAVRRTNIFKARKNINLSMMEIIDLADELASKNPKVNKEIDLDLDKNSIVFNTCLYLKKFGWTNKSLEKLKELALSGDLDQTKYVCKKVLGYYS